MLCLRTLCLVFSLSSRINPFTKAAPLGFHLIPYRWQHLTSELVVPSAEGIEALNINGVAPSGREAEVKDTYDEYYILGEIEFTEEDIGDTGKLDYYLDDGIEYSQEEITEEERQRNSNYSKRYLNFSPNDEYRRLMENIEVGILDDTFVRIMSDKTMASDTNKNDLNDDSNNIQDNKIIISYNDRFEYQKPRSWMNESFVTSTEAVKSEKYFYKLNGQDQKTRDKSKTRIETKDEIMEAVE